MTLYNMFTEHNCKFEMNYKDKFRLGTQQKIWSKYL